ncbi:helix-turn-helix domain-containing protein [Streptomyces canus]|uniref:helix-turn-helix domain-containing protein n=1 Tax=Streptomyces canus TaxID=58343 RepID=UPI00380E2ED0
MTERGGPGSENAMPRAVVQGAFGLLSSLRRLGSARVSDLQRDSGLPRTTVHRLLAQLEEVGAVERSAGRWRLGPTLLELGAGVPAEPRLRMVARRPLMELATSTGALVALSVEMAGQGLVIEVLPGVRRLAREPDPGMALADADLATFGLQSANLAAVRAHRQAHHGDLRPVIDAGDNDPRVSCVAAPLRISPHDVAAVWLMVPGGTGVAAPMVAATRRTAGRIATQLSRPGAR